MLLVAFLICLAGRGSSKAIDGEEVHPENHLVSEPVLPDFIKICHKSDPNLNECIRKSVDIIKPHLVKGIPELKIPPCEPLVLPEIVMNQGKGSVVVQSKYNDMKFYGPTDFQLQQVKVDLDKYKVKMKIHIPKLQMEGEYSITGKILMLPIAGKGLCKGNYWPNLCEGPPVVYSSGNITRTTTNIDAVAIMHGEKYEKNGKTYVNVKSAFIDFNIGHATIHLDNLFDGDKKLGDSMNEFLNDNWKNVSDEMKPVLESTIADVFKKFANNIFSTFPMDTLLPP